MSNSASPGISRDSHYVPMAILRRWSLDGTHVFAYRILVSSPKVPEWRRRSIRGLAYHRDLYTAFACGQELDDFERWLASEYERPGLEAIDKLIRRARLTPEDWRRMARLVAAQDVRTPLSFIEFIRRWDHQPPEMLDRIIRESIQRLEEAKTKGVILNEQSERSEFSDHIEVAIEPPAVPGSDQAMVRAAFPVGRRLWIATMRYLLTGAAETLCRHRLSVAEPDGDAEWPLTDHPALRLNYYKPGHYDFRGGWGNRGSEIMMPVSPRHLLYFQVGSKVANRFTFSEDHTMLVQRLLVERAHRWVFGTRPLGWAAKARPRTVDPERFAAEEAAWEEWHKDQFESEISSSRRQRSIAG